MAPLRELTLDEMLADPIVHLMMARDGVVEADVRRLVRRVLSAWKDAQYPAASNRDPTLSRAA